MKPPQEKLPLNNSIFRLISVSFEKAYLFVEIINLGRKVGATINIYLFCLEKLSIFYQKLVKSNKIIRQHQIINFSSKNKVKTAPDKICKGNCKKLCLNKKSILCGLVVVNLQLIFIVGNFHRCACLHLKNESFRNMNEQTCN